MQGDQLSPVEGQTLQISDILGAHDSWQHYGKLTASWMTQFIRRRVYSAVAAQATDIH